MAKTYHGLASVNNRQYKVDVEGTPGNRIVVAVNGGTVFDKSFNLRSRVDFEVEGRPATVEWRGVGFRMECYLKFEAREFLLQERDSAGQIRPPMDEDQKRRARTISAGVGCIVFAVINLVHNYFSLRDDGIYYPKLLMLSPFLLVFGTALLFTRRGWKGDLPGFMKGWIFFVVAVLVMLGVGSLFNNWFVATFKK